MIMHCYRLFFLVGVILFAACTPASAETFEGRRSAAAVCKAKAETPPMPVLLAGGWSIGKWFSGSGGRTRVVQFCVVTMCVALFIMMRKLN
jgi:hypothetical protein